MSKKIVMIHNGLVIVEAVNEACKREMPDVEVINIIDESLVKDIIKYGKVIPEMARRITRYAFSAQDLGADAVVMTCSSLGETIETCRPMLNIPAYRIDEPMAAYAVETYSNIGLIGTLQSVAGPALRLLERKASEFKRDVSIEKKVCDQAFIELIGGNRAKHDELLTQATIELAKDKEAIVMAQGSMAKIGPEIEKIIKKPVMTVIDIGVKSIAKMVREL